MESHHRDIIIHVSGLVLITPLTTMTMSCTVEGLVSSGARTKESAECAEMPTRTRCHDNMRPGGRLETK